jgi:hypothetical protein
MLAVITCKMEDCVFNKDCECQRDFIFIESMASQEPNKTIPVCFNYKEEEKEE